MIIYFHFLILQKIKSFLINLDKQQNKKIFKLIFKKKLFLPIRLDSLQEINKFKMQKCFVVFQAI